MMHQTETFGFVGIYFQSDLASFLEFQSFICYLGKRVSDHSFLTLTKVFSKSMKSR